MPRDTKAPLYLIVCALVHLNLACKTDKPEHILVESIPKCFESDEMLFHPILNKCQQVRNTCQVSSFRSRGWQQAVEHTCADTGNEDVYLVLIQPPSQIHWNTGSDPSLCLSFWNGEFGARPCLTGGSRFNIPDRYKFHFKIQEKSALSVRSIDELALNKLSSDFEIKPFMHEFSLIYRNNFFKWRLTENKTFPGSKFSLIKFLDTNGKPSLSLVTYNEENYRCFSLEKNAGSPSNRMNNSIAMDTRNIKEIFFTNIGANLSHQYSLSADNMHAGIFNKRIKDECARISIVKIPPLTKTLSPTNWKTF